MPESTQAAGLTEAIIRQNASAESFQRGQEYLQAGAVDSLTRRGNVFEADVEGSQPVPYHVRVMVDAGGITAATCTCPYDWGGWCKHIVAALLAWQHQPESVEERPDLAVVLADLGREQLQAVLLRLAELQPA